MSVAATLTIATGARALPPIDVSEVGTTVAGYRISIGNQSPELGSAGDVNGDGLPDLIVGLRHADVIAFDDAGKSYVVFGTIDPQDIVISEIEMGLGGFVMRGIDPDDYSGTSVGGAGDVNGDGLDDVIIGAPSADPSGVNSAGEAYVVFGKADGTPVNLFAVASGTGGFVITGVVEFGDAGRAVRGAGDVNGDGLADVIIGSPGELQSAGRAYIVFGKADGTPVDLADVVAGSGGYVINGIGDFDSAGLSVDGVGDMNGDGLPDVVVGAPYSYIQGGSYGGEAYLVFGKRNGTPVNLLDVADGQGGFKMADAAPYGEVGHSVSGTGDVNGDGVPDVLIGAPYAEDSYAWGESYVVFGKADGGIVDLSEVSGGQGGFSIVGIEECDYSGSSVSGAGDVNGDGLQDLIIGAYRANPGGIANAGQAYLIFGKADGDTVDLAKLTPSTAGFAINGTLEGHRVGISVTGIGDLNGDGLDDLVIGQSVTSGPDPNPGMVYVIFSPFVRSDLDGDGSVGITDLLILLAAWGPCPAPCPPSCAGDLDNDCMVGITDLLILLADWS